MGKALDEVMKKFTIHNALLKLIVSIYARM